MISMLVAVGAAIAAVSPAYHPRTVGDRPIATPPPYPPAMTDSVHRPGFNGRLHLTRPVIGGHEGPFATVTGSPGAEYYGAWGVQDHVVWARAGLLVIGISPWQRINDAGLQHFERARVTWLREQGFVGGVRTFVNDLSLVADAHADAAEGDAPTVRTFGPDLPPPRATIHFPGGIPQKPRFQVDARDLGRVNLPMNAPSDLRARLESLTDSKLAENTR